MEIRILQCAESYYNPLQLVLNRLEDNLIGKLEGKGKKCMSNYVASLTFTVFVSDCNQLQDSC